MTPRPNKRKANQNINKSKHNIRTTICWKYEVALKNLDAPNSTKTKANIPNATILIGNNIRINELNLSIIIPLMPPNIAIKNTDNDNDEMNVIIEEYVCFKWSPIKSDTDAAFRISFSGKS